MINARPTTHRLDLRAQAFRPSRRAFMVGAAAAGAGLTIGIGRPAGAQGAGAANPFGAYLRIGADNSVTVLCAHMDMGQGAYHGIATLVAEELDCAWSQLRAEGAAGNIGLYGNVMWGGSAQGTGGSTAMASSWERYRRAGALARAMLVQAAARAWNVAPSAIRVENGVLSADGGRRASFGEMADAAAREPLPATVRLKAPADWKAIGREDFRRIDSAAKSNGSQLFTIDIRLPEMLVATIAHPPKFGAKVADVNAADARRVAGVVDVVTISRGVAVLARDTWSALRGREALRIVWDETAAETRDSEAIMAEYRTLGARAGAHPAASRGDAEAALGRAGRVIEATYEFPYLAHAALEPLNAVVRRDGDIIEIWGGHQIPDLYQTIAARIAGTAPDKVRLHVMKTGGGFGRRAVADGDVVAEAVEIAKAIDFRQPVKLQWTRENDMAGGRYRPMMLHSVRVGIDAAGAISGWRHRIVGQSILAGTPFEGMVKNGVDAATVEGVSDTPYAIPDFRVEVTNAKAGVPVLWWRSVGHTHTAYVMETMIDEVAAATGTDPAVLRRRLLAGHPRHLAALDLVLEKAGWSRPPAAGRHRGLAVHESFRTAAAMVVEIAGTANDFKVERVVAAVDCGTAINPDQVRAQVEGGVGFALGAIQQEAVTLKAGQVQQTNFDSYRPLRIDGMPKVEVHIVPSTAAPTGIGEPGVPPLGPALANAIAAAGGPRVRILPMAAALRA